jgi:hypothetical protein
MHKKDFWSWVHPLDKFKLGEKKSGLVGKVSFEML